MCIHICKIIYSIGYYIIFKVDTIFYVSIYIHFTLDQNSIRENVFSVRPIPLIIIITTVKAYYVLF